MAEQQKQKPSEAPAAAPAAPPKKKLPMKTILILVGVLAMEVVTVFVAFSIAGKPSSVHAESPHEDTEKEKDEEIEELVVKDKFSNLMTGVPYIYDTEIYAVVKAKHQERIKLDLEKMGARISTDVAQIISRAQPAHFAEPTHATLTRQIKAALDERIGQDADGEPIVQEVLIRRMLRFKADS